MGRALTTDTGVQGYGLIDLFEWYSTTQHTYNVPSGAKSLIIWLTGGGGGGGGGENDFNAGGGGSGGGTSLKVIVDPLSAYVIKLGAGGNGAPHNNSNPSNGSDGNKSEITDTSNNTILVAPKGYAGRRAQGGNSPERGPDFYALTSGDWTGANFKIAGGGGGPSGGGYNSDNACSGGHGGGTWWQPCGGSVGARWSGTGKQGQTSWGPGTGGGGGQWMESNAGGTSAGGNGQHGGCLIYVYGTP